jgi:hypothetical protein
MDTDEHGYLTEGNEVDEAVKAVSGLCSLCFLLWKWAALQSFFEN